MTSEIAKIPDGFTLESGAPAPDLIIINAYFFNDGKIEIDRDVCTSNVFQYVSKNMFNIQVTAVKKTKAKTTEYLSIASSMLNNPSVNLNATSIPNCICTGHIKTFLQDEKEKTELLFQLMQKQYEKKIFDLQEKLDMLKNGLLSISVLSEENLQIISNRYKRPRHA